MSVMRLVSLGALFASLLVGPAAIAQEEEAIKAKLLKLERPKRVVVYDLVSTEIAEEHLEMVSASLLAEIRKLKGESD